MSGGKGERQGVISIVKRDFKDTCGACGMQMLGGGTGGKSMIMRWL